MSITIEVGGRPTRRWNRVSFELEIGARGLTLGSLKGSLAWYDGLGTEIQNAKNNGHVQSLTLSIRIDFRGSVGECIYAAFRSSVQVETVPLRLNHHTISLSLLICILRNQSVSTPRGSYQHQSCSLLPQSLLDGPRAES